MKLARRRRRSAGRRRPPRACGPRARRWRRCERLRRRLVVRRVAEREHAVAVAGALISGQVASGSCSSDRMRARSAGSRMRGQRARPAAGARSPCRTAAGRTGSGCLAARAGCRSAAAGRPGGSAGPRLAASSTAPAAPSRPRAGSRAAAARTTTGRPVACADAAQHARIRSRVGRRSSRRPARSTPPPASRRPRASAVSSVLGARSVGVGSPVSVLWLMVREVEKPKAPARTASAASARICGDVGRRRPSRAARRARPSRSTRSGACGSRAPMSMSRGRALERVEVFGEGLPVPVQALVQDGAGDVLDAFHQLDQLLAVGRRGRARSRRRNCPSPRWSRRARSRAPAASPRSPGRRSGCGCRRSPGVTSRPRGRDLLRARAGDRADRGDPAVLDRDIGLARAGPVPSTTVPPRITRS